VVRGQESGPPTGASQRKHAAAAPVTLAQLKGIYVHAKIMIIDDAFVAIGSTNLNRRGFFHDGELTAFIIPGGLRASMHNPARALRAALWAEHLGLPPGMGPVLLRDFRAALPLFGRPISLGNRFTPATLTHTRPFAPTTAALGGTGLKALARIGQLGIAATAAALEDQAWSKAIDPTTATDPEPAATLDAGG
jgi:hypothetical protein